MAPPLIGVPASAPYFHNGSVPTVYGVLTAEARPKSRPLPTPYCVEVRLRIPSSEIVTPQQEAEQLDAALKMAFATVRRQLREAIVEQRPSIAG